MSEWNIVSQETETVMDTNPSVWLNAAKKALKNNQYEEALTNAKQMRVLTNESSMVKESYAIDIAVYYGKGDSNKAKETKNKYTDWEWSLFFADKPSYLTGYIENNRNEWESVWNMVIKNWIDGNKFTILELHLNLFGNSLANLADNNFVCEVVSKDKVTLLQSLFSGGYNLNGVLNENRDNLLMISVMNCAEKSFDFLLNNRINDINAKNKDGRNALMYAVCNGFEDIAQRLINARADVNACDNEGNTALMYAASKENSCVTILLNAGVDINRVNQKGFDALYHVVGGYVALRYVTSNNNSHKSGSLLPMAAMAGVGLAGMMAAATVIKNNNPSADYKKTVHYISTEDTIKFLLNKGANLQIRYENSDNQTPLLVATSNNKGFNVLQILAEAGSDINAEDDNERDALYYSVQNQNYNFVEYLLNHGVDPNKIYQDTNNLLLKIAASNHWEGNLYNIASLLISHGANINVQDSSGNTPLMLSVNHSWSFSNELGLARLLVQKGAKLGIRNKGGDKVNDILRRRNIPLGDLHNNQTSYTKATGFMRLFR